MEIKNIKHNYDNNICSFQLVISAEEFAPYIDQMRREKPNAFLTEVHKSAGREAIPPLFEKACIQRGFVPVSKPDFNVEKCGADGIICVCSFVNYPEVTELNWKGLSVEKPVKLCTEEDVDQAIAKYMRNHPYSRPTDRPAQMGDLVDISFSGTSEGKGFFFDHSDNTRFQVGAGTIFYGLDEAIVGHSAGDEFELTLTMPDDFRREQIRGKTLDLKIKLKIVLSRDILECTDEYVKSMINGYDSLAQFREYQRKHVQAVYDAKSDIIYENRVRTALAKMVTCSIPDVMTDAAVEPYVTAMDITAMRHGKKVEEYLAEIGKTLEQYKAHCRPRAEEQVRLSLALDYIIRTEGVQATQDEYDSLVAEYAKKRNIDIASAVKLMGGEDAIIEQILSGRALSLVVKCSNPVEIKVDALPEN